MRAWCRTAGVAAVTAAAAGAQPAPPPAVSVSGCGAAADARSGAAPGAEGDRDRDGLDDGCEFALAPALAPELVVDAGDCLWQDGPGDGGRLAGGYLFAAQPAGGGVVRLAYLPAYTRDCGWQGVRCWPRGCGAHAGDSELVVVDAVRAPDAAPDAWRAAGVFLTAHCFGRSGGRCRWFRGAALGAFRWSGAAPTVWVARGKHAHYPSRRACDGGHWGYDTCDRNRRRYRFPVRAAAQNVGSRAAPRPRGGGCVAAAELALGVRGAAPAARECAWDDARPFRGWQPDSAGRPPTPYGRLLARVAGL